MTTPIEWRDLPPKTRTASEIREDQVAAGRRIRKAIEQDRRSRGIDPEGIFFPGDEVANPVPGQDPHFAHGEQYTYVKHGCRCEACRRAHYSAQQQWRRKSKATGSR